MRVSVKNGERLFVNGAVLRFHGRSQVEFLNDVQFLMEAHVMQEEEVTTPAGHLYFQIQLLLIELGSDDAPAYASAMHRAQITYPASRDLLGGVDKLVATRRYHEAMKRLRPLLPRSAA